MNRGKEAPLSLCEKKFLLDAIKDSKRLDGREVYDYRSINITLGSSPGHVEVKLGDTRVFACVSCHVIQPRPQRPTEGQLYFNLELSPMASPSFDVGRPSSLSTEINRTLERCVKESRAVDTESLCIIAGEKVWEVRVDVHVLDHCGNIVDCAAIASLTALKHFRRPDVTVIGEEATIHPVTEREPVPLSVHHMPLCFTFAFFHGGEYLLVDPALSEESVMEGKLVIGMNVHREICSLQMTGGVAIQQEQVTRCTQIAAVKCIEVTEVIKKALSKTESKKEALSSILQTKVPREELPVPVAPMESEDGEEEMEEGEASVSRPEVVYLDKSTAELGLGGPNTWELLTAANTNWSSSEDETIVQEKTQNGKKKKKNGREKKTKKKTQIDQMENASGSEEEETVTLTNSDIGGSREVGLGGQETPILVEDSFTEETVADNKAGKRKKAKKGSQKTSTPAMPSAAAAPKTSSTGQRTRRQKKQK